MRPKGPCGPVIAEDIRMGSLSIWHWILVLAVGLRVAVDMLTPPADVFSVIATEALE